MKHRSDFPWRFSIGAEVWVHGWVGTARIIDRYINDYGFPHYFLADENGIEYLVPQIHLSSRIIST